MRRLISSLMFMIVVQQLLTFPVAAQKLSFTDSLDHYISRGMKDWNVPGLAIVIVKDGKIIIRKGYGVRDIQTSQAVDENTLFMIASNSKLFTGTALANLEYQKKLSLNDRITKYFPDFKLFEPATTQMVTIRDMLTHRIGTKTFQGDFTFWNSTLNRKDIMKRMQLLKPVALFRQDYGYCNSCFLAAGQVVQEVTGITWEKYVDDSILTILQMNRSTAMPVNMETLENTARPYTTGFSGQLARVPYDQWDNLAPAASVISSVHDLSHWLLFQLDSGRYKGMQVLPFQVLQMTRDVSIMISSRKHAVLPVHFRGYGLGLFVADYNSRQVFWHTGGAAGMLSNVCFVPEERLGIAILTNNDNQNFFESLRYQVLDAYLDVPYTDRSKQALPAFEKEMKDQLQKINAWKKRINVGKLLLPLSAYEGEYTNKLYGTMTISEKDGMLHLRFNSHNDLSAQLQYMDNDEWLLQYNNLTYGIFAVRFIISRQKVLSVDIRANDFVEYDPYTFTKK